MRNVYQKVYQRAGQLSLPHVTNIIYFYLLICNQLCNIAFFLSFCHLNFMHGVCITKTTMKQNKNMKTDEQEIR